MLHLVRQLIHKTPYRLVLQFNTSKIHSVDLKSSLEEWSKGEESIFRDLLDSEQFLTVDVHPEMETVVWSNGVDLCPDVLYQLAVEQQKLARDHEPTLS